MYNLFDDEDDILQGSPKSKYFDTLKAANQILVEQELTRQIERQVALEHFLEKYMGENFSEEIDRYIFNNEEAMEKDVRSMYVECMGNIISRNE